MTKTEIINCLLEIEHEEIAYKAKLIKNKRKNLNYELVVKAIGCLDDLSFLRTERSLQEIMVIISIIWTYKKDEWTGLRDIFVNILSRIGFAPTAKMFNKTIGENGSNIDHLTSFFTEINVITNQLKYEISVNNHIFLLTNFQKRIWDSLVNSKLIGISAPTSAGKSFIILLKALDLFIERKGTIIYIVPTLSLINQVTDDFRKIFKDFGINNALIKTNYDESDRNTEIVYILTQEKAISAFEQQEVPFSNVSLLVVDEIQNLERVADDNDNRAKILYDTLIEFRNTVKPFRTILAGPRIEKLKKLGIEIFNEDSSNELSTTSSPVCNITYSISKVNNEYYFKQYCDLFSNPKFIKIENQSLIQGYGKTTYDESYVNFFNEFLKNLGNGQLNIIFSPTSKKAEEIAYLNYLSENVIDANNKRKSLSEYIKNTIHPNYSLATLVKKGIAYHHGRLPLNIRFVIEKAMKENLINNIFCTTTLMQGVNLPAQNLFMRNPDLAMKSKNGNKPKLTNYELSNLRGRTGRLMHDLLGRSFIMDESNFVKEELQSELFEPTYKTINVGYEDSFTNNRNKIIDTIKTTNELRGISDVSFISTYIRQTVLKYGNKSIGRLKQVGIVLSGEEYLAINTQLETLSIPKTICIKNRYWDPFTLNRIYLNQNFTLPTNLFEPNFVNKLTSILFYIHYNYPDYFYKYLRIEMKSENYNSYIEHLSILAKDWITEKSLHFIFSKPYYSDKPEKISESISEINNKIAYGLPRLLKPFYDIKNANSDILSYFELGIYEKLTKQLLSMNIPRETAIYLKNKYFESKKEYTNDDIISVLASIYDNEDYWVSIQFSHLL